MKIKIPKSTKKASSDQPNYSVWEINHLLKTTIENAPFLHNINISGEIIQLKPFYAGNQLFFTLSDGKASINCNCFLNVLDRIKFEPRNSVAVRCSGKIILSQRKGNLMFHVHYMEEIGVGDQSILYEKLKKKLAKEGVFNAQHKQMIPKYPAKIGIITSWNSAAMWDFITIINQQAPHIRLMVCPATVQGNQAVPSIINAIKSLNTQKSVEVIAIIRGGGSPEDLASFNNESIVRAIHHSPIPIITGIGHEIDDSLSDKASDKRCETPTAAAKFISEHTQQAKHSIRLTLHSIQTIIRKKRDQHYTKSQSLIDQLSTQIRHKKHALNAKLSALTHRVTLSNPIKTLHKGFAKIEKIDNSPLTSVQQATKNEKISIHLLDGTLISEVKEINHEDRTHH